MSSVALDEIKLTDVDFESVKQCTDKRVIKRYIKLLEEDGDYFVDLTKACKQKFLELAPKEYYLMYPRQTTAEEYDDAQRDIFDWEDSVNERDKELREYKNKRSKDLIWDDDLGAKITVPIRGQEPVVSRPNIHKGTEIERKAIDGERKENDVYARDKTKMKDYYKAWDQVDVDEMEAEFDRREAEEEAARKKHFEDLKDLQDEVHQTTPIAVAGVGKDVPEAHRRYMAESEKEKGNEAFYSKDFEEAEAYYSRSLQYKADDPSTWANRALVRLKLQRPAEALEDCNHGLALNPTYMKGLHRKGKALYELQRYEEAVKYFQLALAESPGNTQINGDLMVARRKLRSEPPAPAPSKPMQETSCRIEELPDDEPPTSNYTRVVIEEDSDSEDDNGAPSNDRVFRKIQIEEVDDSESEDAEKPVPLGGSTGGAGGEIFGDIEGACGGTGEAVSQMARPTEGAGKAEPTGFRKVPIVEDSDSDQESGQPPCIAPSSAPAFAPPVRNAVAQPTQAPVVEAVGVSFDDMD